MGSSKIQIFLAIFVLCQSTSCVFGLDSLLHFGDFMEFHIGLHEACANTTGAERLVKDIGGPFVDCTEEVRKGSTDMFDTIAAICKNRDSYFQCWDQMKADTLNKCGKDKEPMLPVLYRNTVVSFCGTDNGAKKLEEMRNAVKEIKPEDADICPESTGIHWLENCQALIPKFVSTDLCQRHEAIDKCVGKITCENVSIAKLIRQMYTNGRSLLQCKN